MTVDQKKIKISKELSDYIIPLTAEEFDQLEKNIIANGCRDPLILWKKDRDQLILVDGHNRYKICQRNGISFKVQEMSFPSLDHAKVWMVDNQMGRRNLTPDQLSYYRGLKYLSLKKEKGGYANVKQKGVNELHTTEILSDRFSVSESTIKRDSKFAEGLNIISRSNPKLKTRILSGESKVKKADVQMLASAQNKDRITIRNEADLYNKAKIIRDEILDEVESRIKNLESEKIKNAQKILQASEPVFLDKGDRVRRIKGNIISAINRAINKKDVKAIKELRHLIDELADLLFE